MCAPFRVVRDEHIPAYSHQPRRETAADRRRAFMNRSYKLPADDSRAAAPLQGELQLQVMRTLWRLGAPCSVEDVRRAPLDLSRAEESRRDRRSRRGFAPIGASAEARGDTTPLASLSKRDRSFLDALMEGEAELA